MEEKNLTENVKGKRNSFTNERKDLIFLKGFTLIALIPLWVGYAFSLYKGDSNNLSDYSLLIIGFSLINFNTLCGVEKIKNSAFNLLAKIDGILFFIWAVIAIISIFLK